MAKVLITEPFRLIFPRIFGGEVKEDSKGKERNRYSIVMVFHESDQYLKVLNDVITETGKTKFGNAKFRKPFKKVGEAEGDWDVTKYPYMKGMVSVEAWCYDIQPQVVNQQVKPILDPSELYSGCYCRASITPGAFEYQGIKRTNFFLNNIQKVKDGEHLDSRTAAEDDFTPLETPENEVNNDDLF